MRGNIIEYNVSIGNPQGFRAAGREGQAPCVIRRNYAEYTRNGIHNSHYYEAEDNTLARIEKPLPEFEPQRFGFFGGVPAEELRPGMPLAEQAAWGLGEEM